ncbi:hypothetical protein J2Z42_002951 [Clostridium algifaecis]|uniref:Secreted protein n=1 Tax=Clostridium algifaecis TaxID=1472040 RepID=A0ABS4KW07_9CLOT|nr:hypothetical protein [Clostridium algifaecis]
MAASVCSSAVLTAPLVLVQYCSFKTWEVESASTSALLSGVFTQNSSSVAQVATKSSISSIFIPKGDRTAGYFLNNSKRVDLK